MKFNLLPLKMIVAVDAAWSLNGLALPFSAWVDYDAVYNRGVRYDIPEIEPFPVTQPPAARFLKVGDLWDETAGREWTGMRDPYIEAMTEFSNCAPELRENSRGNVTWALETDKTFDVDEESAAMIEMFEMDRLIEKYHAGYPLGGITSGYKWYVQYGSLQLSHSQAAEHDEILRRTAFKDRLGLTLEYDIEKLLAMSVSFADLPPEAYREWGHKGTTESAQTLLLLEAA